MSRPRDDSKRAAGVATLVCLAFGCMACGHADPIIDRSGGASAAGVVLQAGTGVTPPRGGVGIPVAGIGGGIAGIGGGVAGIGVIAAGTGVGSAGSLGPAGVGAATGGTGAVVPLAPFDAGIDPNRNQVTPGMLCSRLAVIDCAGEAHCCTNPGRTVDACRAAIMMTCTSDLYIDDLAMNPSTGFDATAASAAYTTLEQKASQCDPTVAAWGGSADGLRGILKGTIAPNGNCKPSGNAMDLAVSGAALASCTDITTTACLPKSALGQWTCAPRNAAGGACVTDNNCKDGIYCNVAKNQFIGKCSARKALGASCTAGPECESLYCKASKCVAASQQAAYCLAAN